MVHKAPNTQVLNKRTCPLINFGKLSTLKRACPFIEFQKIVPFIRAHQGLLNFQYFMQPLMQKRCVEEGKGGIHQVQYKQVSAIIIEDIISTLPFYYKAYFSPANLFQSRKCPACPFSRHISTLPFYKIFINCPPCPLIRACPLIKHLRVLAIPFTPKH